MSLPKATADVIAARAIALGHDVSVMHDRKLVTASDDSWHILIAPDNSAQLVIDITPNLYTALKGAIALLGPIRRRVGRQTVPILPG
jgi:hypothetical protein